MKQSNYLAIQDLILKITTISLTIVFARLLSKEEFGLYSQVFLVIGFLSTLAGSSLPMGLSYFYGQYRSFTQRQILFKRFFYTSLLISLSITIIFLLLNNELTQLFQNHWFTDYRLPLAVLLAFSVINGYFKNFNLLTKQLKRYLLVNVIVVLGLFVLQIINIITEKNLFVLFSLFAGAQFVIFTFLFLGIKKFLLLKSEKKLIIKTEFKYILPLSAIGLISVINELVDQVMVSMMLDPVAMAELKIGSFQIPFISIITVAATTVLLPIFSRLISENKTKEIVLRWKNVTNKTTVLLLPIFVFCLLFSQEIMGLLFSEKYDIAPLIFQIYIMKYFLTVLTFGAVMGSIGLQKEWMKNIYIIVSINIITNYFAIQSFGIIGAAVTTSFVWYIGAMLQVYQINKKLKCHFTDYFPVRHYFKVLFVAVLYTSISYIIFHSLKLDNIFVIPFAIVYYLISVYTFDKKFEFLKKGLI